MTIKLNIVMIIYLIQIGNYSNHLAEYSHDDITDLKRKSHNIGVFCCLGRISELGFHRSGPGVFLTLLVQKENHLR